MPFIKFDNELMPREVNPELEKVKKLDFLIKDEAEAIDGYIEAIALFEGNEEICEKLREIKSEEQVHIEELSKLLKSMSKAEEK